MFILNTILHVSKFPHFPHPRSQILSCLWGWDPRPPAPCIHANWRRLEMAPPAVRVLQGLKLHHCSRDCEQTVGMLATIARRTIDISSCFTPSKRPDTDVKPFDLQVRIIPIELLVLILSTLLYNK